MAEIILNGKRFIDILPKEPYVSERTKQRILADLQWKGEVSTRYTVLYLKDRKEHRTPWFKRRENANVALKLMQQMNRPGF